MREQAKLGERILQHDSPSAEVHNSHFATRDKALVPHMLAFWALPIPFIVSSFHKLSTPPYQGRDSVRNGETRNLGNSLLITRILSPIRAARASV